MPDVSLPRSLAFWPEGTLNAEDFAEQWRHMEPLFMAKVMDHALPQSSAIELAGIYLPLAAWIQAHRKAGMTVIGINGAQGSGKTTLCDFLALILTSLYGLRVTGFSLDDLYKTRSARERMAQNVHPLFITRGVPGTHDIALGLDTLKALESAAPDTLTALPSFNKAMDDRRPQDEWPIFKSRPDVVLLEGWCLGSEAQPAKALIDPVNDLERSEDAQGNWRTHVNDQLNTDYRRLWAKLDALVMLRSPGMDCVLEWRGLQENKLAAKTGNRGQQGGLMNPEAIRRFIMHFERLTQYTLEEMPSRADVLLELDAAHQFAGVQLNSLDVSRA